MVKCLVTLKKVNHTKDMIVEKISKQDLNEAIDIAKSLPEWFTPEGQKNMAIDFDNNNLIVEKEDDIVKGFLCYTTYDGKMLIIWMGIRPEFMGKGIGANLLNWLTNKAKDLGMYAIEVETLPEEVEYEPYAKTRAFYYKNGFKRIAYKKATIDGWDDQIVLEKNIR